MINFIRKLQQAEEAVRRRWLYLGTAVSVVLVVGLWLGYLGLTVPALQSAAGLPVKEPASFWSTLGAGLQEIKEQTREGLANSFFYFDRQLRQPRVLEISR